MLGVCTIVDSLIVCSEGLLACLVSAGVMRIRGAASEKFSVGTGNPACSGGVGLSISCTWDDCVGFAPNSGAWLLLKRGMLGGKGLRELVSGRVICRTGLRESTVVGAVSWVWLRGDCRICTSGTSGFADWKLNGVGVSREVVVACTCLLSCIVLEAGRGTGEEPIGNTTGLIIGWLLIASCLTCSVFLDSGGREGEAAWLASCTVCISG